MKNLIFTHPHASGLAEMDARIVHELMYKKEIAILPSGERKVIAQFKSFTMYSQEASRFELIDEEGYLIAFYANGQFWDSLTKRLVTLE